MMLHLPSILLFMLGVASSISVFGQKTYRQSLSFNTFQQGIQLNYERQLAPQHSLMLAAIWHAEGRSQDSWIEFIDVWEWDMVAGPKAEIHYRYWLGKSTPGLNSGVYLSALAGHSWRRTLDFEPARLFYQRSYFGSMLGYRALAGRLVVVPGLGLVYRVPWKKIPDWYKSSNPTPFELQSLSNNYQGLHLIGNLEIGWAF
ncbi:MAG: hypothetical protein AAF804_09775 [Bacteroidota bacterium]